MDSKEIGGAVGLAIITILSYFGVRKRSGGISINAKDWREVQELLHAFKAQANSIISLGSQLTHHLESTQEGLDRLTRLEEQKKDDTNTMLRMMKDLEEEHTKFSNFMAKDFQDVLVRILKIEFDNEHRRRGRSN